MGIPSQAAPADEGRPDPRYLTRLVALFCAGWAVIYADRTILYPLLTVIAGEFGLTGFQTDFSSLVAALAQAPGFVPWNSRAAAPFVDAGDAAQGLLATHAAGLARLSREMRLDRIRRVLGVPSAVVLR